MVRLLSVACLLLVLSVASSDGAELGDLDGAELQDSVQQPGTLGSYWWRIRSISNAVGEYWQIKELEFYESKDGSGNAVSADSIEKTVSSTYKDSPAPGQPDESEHPAEKATDGDAATFWSSSSDIKFEFVAVKFTTPKDIRSIKCQLTEVSMGPAMVIVEKSFDGENWARSTEISDMLKWGERMQMYPLIDMDIVPQISTFALRFQTDPRFCVGVRETPAEDEEDPALPLEPAAILEVQICADARTTQYWKVRPDNLLGNAKDTEMVVHVAALADQGALDMQKHACDEAEDGTPVCPAWMANSQFAFSEEAKGGLMHSKSDNNANLVITADAIEEGAEVKWSLCGADGENPADAASCTDANNARFELKPMFLIESRKMAIACAPYTHMNIEPAPVENELEAMKKCAAQADCLAYNFATADAACPSDPPCEGKYQLHAWACTALHEIHSSQEGWSLGVRAGKLEPFAEERAW